MVYEWSQEIAGKIKVTVVVSCFLLKSFEDAFPIITFSIATIEADIHY